MAEYGGAFAPLEVVDQCLDKEVLVLLQGKKEITGILRGFDDNVNLVIDNVTDTEHVSQGKLVEKRDRVLLNGVQ
ncbi:hypothetical protein KIPB_009566, partial [Kipferlia bialata]|eukprot:g9566.t1